MHVRARVLWSVWLLAMVVGGPVAQVTYVVAASGVANFRDIPPAIQAARPGDIILVRAGTYSGFVVRRGMRIVGGPGVLVTPGASGILAVSGLPLGETVVLSGLASAAVGFGADVLLENNAGHVHLEAMKLDRGVVVRNCQLVSCHAIRSAGGPCVAITDSTVAMSECVLTASPGGLSVHHGIDVLRSRLTLSYSMVVGGLDGYGILGPGSAILLRSGVLMVTGDSLSRLRAGEPRYGLAAPPAAAILTHGGVIRIDPLVGLVSYGGAARIVGPALVTAHRLPSVRAKVRSGQLIATVRAPAASNSYLLAGGALRSPVSFPFGELWIGASYAVFDAGLVGPSELRTGTAQLPVLAPGTLLTLQAIITRSVEVRLSTPVTLTLE